jgi:Tfp pilus assembly protein PilN
MPIDQRDVASDSRRVTPLPVQLPKGMKAVNLLPSDLRGAPKASAAISARTDVPRGPGAFIVLGALAFAVLALAGYVLTSNTIKDRQSQLSQLEVRQQAAQRRTAALAPYATFDQLAKQRATTVRDLAGQRFDWDQTLRDLSRALPENVSIKSLNGSLGGASAPAGAAAAKGTSTGPSITLTGCTRSQSAVARLMSRLYSVNGVTRVSLGSSQESKADAATPTAGESSDNVGPLCGAGTRPDFSLVIHFKSTGAAATSATPAQSGTTPAAAQAAAGVQAATTPTQPTATATPQPGAQAATGGASTASTSTTQGGTK